MESGFVWIWGDERNWGTDNIVRLVFSRAGEQVSIVPIDEWRVQALVQRMIFMAGPVNQLSVSLGLALAFLGR